MKHPLGSKTEGTVVPRIHEPTVLMTAIEPTADGTLRHGQWDYPSLAYFRASTEQYGQMNPWAFVTVIVGGDVVAVHYPEWIPEQDESKKSPKQLAWEKLSQQERDADCLRRARRFIGFHEYDPASVKIAFAGKAITPGDTTSYAEADFESLDGVTGRRVRRTRLTARGTVIDLDGTQREETDEEYQRYLARMGYYEASEAEAKQGLLNDPVPTHRHEGGFDYDCAECHRLAKRAPIPTLDELPEEERRVLQERAEQVEAKVVLKVEEP